MNIVQVNIRKQNCNTAENIYSHVHVYTQSSIPMYMHSGLQLTSITFCKKKKCPTLKIIHTSCVKINNKQMNSIKNKMYTFSFQSHLVIWTAHAYSFMMLFLTSSNYTEKKPTILNMQNPILNKKSSRPMLKKYDLFIIIIKHEKLCGYNFYNKQSLKWKITRFNSSLYFLQLEYIINYCYSMKLQGETKGAW